MELEPLRLLYFLFFIIFFLLIAITKSQKIKKKPYYYVSDQTKSNSTTTRTTSVLQLPPSPPSLPLLGHLHLVKKPLHRTLTALSHQHGPVLYLRLGSRPVLLVSAPSAVEQCFTTNDVAFANRPLMLAAKHLNYNFTTLVSASYGPMWRNLRRFTLLEVFSATRLHVSSSTRHHQLQALLKTLFSSNNRDKFKRVELKSKFNELVLNTIMKMMGMREEDLETFREIMRESVELIGSPYIGDYLRWLRWLDLRGVEKRMVRLKRRRDGFLKGVLEERRRRRASGGGGVDGDDRSSTIDVMLALQEREPDFYTDEIIFGIIMTLLTTGTHTSAMTMEWAMSLMLNHPRTLAKARAEIESRVGTQRLVQEEDLPNLPYLNSIINETLRLFPPTSIIVPHESSEECVVGGFKVPRGTMLLVNAWAIHRDPKNWVDPQEFRPERFGDGGEGDEGLKFKFIPFGFGRRGCPGTRMAMRMVGLTLGRLVQCFEWERVGEEEVEMSEGPGITIPKVQPLEAMYRPRQAMATAIFSN